MKRILAALCAVAMAGSAHHANAQEERHLIRIQSGTGFLVNREYVVTNAHVLRNCDKAVIRNPDFLPEQPVIIRARDEQHDLALLQTNVERSQFAPLRYNIDDLAVGDKVFVIGYPGAKGLKGEATFASAKVEDLARSVQGNPDQFYITDVVDHGNSGGPVFDSSGNVIGVVVAKTTLNSINAATHETIASHPVGVAISLATLKQFLLDQGVYAQWIGSGPVVYPDEYMQDKVKSYIVNVQCTLPEGFVPPSETR